MEFGNELLGALYLADRAPFVFFNAIALPAYYSWHNTFLQLCAACSFNFLKLCFDIYNESM